jgi:hypothetical protein
MGFHKRWITEEVLVDKYRRRGIAEIESYLGHADAFVTNDKLSSEVIDLFNTPHLDNIERWNLISELIAMRSIEIGFNK